MADLLICMEPTRVPRAIEDPVLLNDIRVLKNLVIEEKSYAILESYFNCVQTDIKPHMRKMVTEWMGEVCVEQKTEEEVFPLAVNYLDRFLAIHNIPRTRLQCLGAACMLLASKLKENIHMPAEQLVLYTDNSITFTDLMEMESTVLHVLKWDLSAVTPCDYVALLVHRISLDPKKVSEVKQHAQMFIRFCVTDNEFMLYSPSLVAAASVCVSVQAVIPTPIPNLLEKIHYLTGIDLDLLEGCHNAVQQIVATYLKRYVRQHNLPSSQVVDTSFSKVTTSPTCQSTTPTDVRDITFCMDDQNRRCMSH